MIGAICVIRTHTLFQIMIRTLLAVVSFFFVLGLDAQEVYVPYRTGNLFGISSVFGKTVVKADYDIIRFCEEDNYFQAYKSTGDEVVSTLFHKKKKILQMAGYLKFSVQSGVILAMETKLNESTKSRKYFLYNSKGTKTMEFECQSAKFLIALSNPAKGTIVMEMIDNKKLYNLWSIDVKTGEIQEKILDEVVHYRVNYSNLESKNELKITLQESVSSYKEYSIRIDNDVYEKIPTSESKYRSLTYDDGVQYKKEMRDIYMRESTKEDAGVTTVKKMETEKSMSLGNYKSSDGDIPTSYPYLIFRDLNGVGLLDSDMNVVFSPIYSNIMVGTTNVFLTLTKQAQYGILLRTEQKLTSLVQPIFTQRIFLEKASYCNKQLHIVSLYDTKGKFLYYADQTGREFYSPN